MTQLLKVTAAIICDADKILLCQRPKEKRHGLLWEFPGGKVEPNESEEDCIVRECKEELDVELEIIKKIDVIEADNISITYFKTKIIDGVLNKKEHNDIHWIKWSELPNYDLCPNDKKLTLRHNEI